MKETDGKAKRHAAILQLLAERRLGNQRQIAEVMAGQGFLVTQSSISRDLRELGIAKIAGRYLPPRAPARFDPTASPASLVTDIQPAGSHLIVVKTPIGAANIVGVAIDNRGIEGLVGTVAGDDTIFVAVRNKRAQARVLEALRGME